MSHRVWKTMPIKIKGGRKRKTRPKTFKTEEAAKKYGDASGKKYTLKFLQKDKIRVDF